MNAIVRELGPDVDMYDQETLDKLQAEVHRDEVQVCPEGRTGPLLVVKKKRGNTPNRDAVPAATGGYYTADTLVVALQRHELVVTFGTPSSVPPVHHLVGCIVGTGDHYVAVVRCPKHNGRVWMVVDNGQPTPRLGTTAKATVDRFYPEAKLVMMVAKQQPTDECVVIDPEPEPEATRTPRQRTPSPPPQRPPSPVPSPTRGARTPAQHCLSTLPRRHPTLPWRVRVTRYAR